MSAIFRCPKNWHTKEWFTLFCVVLVDGGRTQGKNRFLLRQRTFLAVSSAQRWRGLPWKLWVPCPWRHPSGAWITIWLDFIMTMCHPCVLHKASQILRTMLKIIYFDFHLIERESKSQTGWNLPKITKLVSIWIWSIFFLSTTVRVDFRNGLKTSSKPEIVEILWKTLSWIFIWILRCQIQTSPKGWYA